MTRDGAPERWLHLFGTVCATFHLLLGVIFTVVTPIVPLPAFMDLPAASSAAKSPEFESDLIISLRRTGETYLQDRVIDRSTLVRELAAGRTIRGDEPTVRLRADRDTAFGSVRKVVSATQSAGYRRVVIMVRNDRSSATVDAIDADPDSGFTLSSCWDCESTLAPFAMLAALFFFAPVGAVVMRHHIASASGRSRIAGRVLQGLAFVSLPFAVLLIAGVLVQLLAAFLAAVA